MDAVIVLHCSTGSPAGDEVARSVIAAFEAAFPGRVRGYYLEGSYADGTGIATSDLDLVTVFTAAFLDAAERDRAEILARQLAAHGALAADLTIVDEQQLSAGVDPAIKLGSRCLFGEDIRDRLPLLPIEVWTRQRMHAAYWLIIHVFDRPAVVVHPIDYPAPAGEFYGYDNRAVLLPDGTPARSTRNLIRVTGWAATALIAAQAGIYVARKR